MRAHPSKEIRCALHANHFDGLGWEQQLNWLWTQNNKSFACRRRLCPGSNDTKSVRILNRTVQWDEAGFMYEGGQRHAEISMNEKGLVDNSVKSQHPSRRVSEQVGIAGQGIRSTTTTRYRGTIARMNYLGQGRGETQNAVKDVEKQLSRPSEASWVKLKRLVRYLKGAPMSRIRCAYQSNTTGIIVWADG